MLLLIGIPSVNATTEIRYMRSDTWTVNTYTGYKFQTSRSGYSAVYSVSKTSAQTTYWGIRVYVLHSNGSTDEKTTDYSAQVTRSTTGYGIQASAWTCPLTSLASTDAILVKVSMKVGSDAWVQCGAFVTEQLDASQLDNVAWTVYYFTAIDKVGSTYYHRYRWDSSTYNSRIGNFQWTPAYVKSWHHISWNWNLETRTWANHDIKWEWALGTRTWFNHKIDWNFDLATKQWNSILWNFNLGTMAWHSIVWQFILRCPGWHSIIRQFFLNPESNIAILFIGVLFIGLIIAGILIFKIRKK